MPSLFRRRPRTQKADAPEPPFEDVVRRLELPEPIHRRLAALYAQEPQRGSDGELHDVDGVTRCSALQGALLHDLHRRAAPELSVEVGLAYGYSTLFFLASMEQTGRGSHVAIDPFQFRRWRGIGATHAEELGHTDRFELREQSSAQALVELHAAGRRAQFVFIDGDHKFDTVLMDLTLSAQILDVGGLIVLDDLWMPAIRRVAEFFRSNRADFEQEEHEFDNVAVFRRVSAEDGRPWDHFVDFGVAPAPRGG